ncbi:MAG: CNNM domain-containing protein [Treponema sp.]
MESDRPPPNSIWGLLLVALVLIILSLIFSASESAFLSINKLRVRFLRNQKDKRAVRTWKLLNNKEKLINTLLVGNNIVNIAISSILTIVAMDLFGNAGVGIATFTATILLLIFGEITPKTVATRHPESIAFFFSGFIYVVEIILTPLVFIFTAISRTVLKLFKINTMDKKVSFTEEEIKTFIDVGGEEGVLEKNEKSMMRRVFKFTDLEAKDIMVPRKKIISIPMTARYTDVVELSERYKLSRFPVYKKDIDDIVGILYIKDMLKYKNSGKHFVVSDVMRPPLFIFEVKKMSSIQQMLMENKQSMAIVVDEYSGTAGLLTYADIEREIFGPITDVNKKYSHGATNAFIRGTELKIENPDDAKIYGQVRLADLNEQLHTHLSSKRAETIGGYICEALGRIPNQGESVIREGYKFTVTGMDEKRVAAVHVQSSKEEE